MKTKLGIRATSKLTLRVRKQSPQLFKKLSRLLATTDRAESLDEFRYLKTGYDDQLPEKDSANTTMQLNPLIFATKTATHHYAFLLFLVVCMTQNVSADLALMKTHCGKCHTGSEAEGEFGLTDLGKSPNRESVDLWINSLEYVQANEMPPAKQNHMTAAERKELVRFLSAGVRKFEKQADRSLRIPPRRLNNRELANSLRDVLMIEDVGTHQPLAMLLGDTLEDGFDTHGDALGFSEYHLDQYVTAIRKVLDATILVGERPTQKNYEVPTEKIVITDLSNRKRTERANRTKSSIEILDIRHSAYFSNFETVPTSGRYRIKIRAVAVDRHVYDSAATGIHDGDPIRLRVHMGDRIRDFALEEGEPQTLELNEWLAAGSTLRITYPTDGLRLLGNGNFKFQYRIAHDYLKENKPALYEHVVKNLSPKRRVKTPSHWSHWTDHWQGPRPRLFNATIEGPYYDSWPSERQHVLLGENPTATRAAEILKPIARRAWRRQNVDQELAPIVRLVQSQAESLGDVEALKEGILATLLSPSFLLINPDDVTTADRWATKVSYLLSSTTPNGQLLAAARDGKLDSFDSVHAHVASRFSDGDADDFLSEFPAAWLQLDRINFMSPDPDRYRMYERKNISEDMVNEAVEFFRYAAKQNRPVPELLTADYSFVNADLARVYEIDGVAEDSKLRRYVFTNGRRGGFLGMGAFLTLTADSLGTSPIHRAVYVMENFMGIEPTPPPADVKISEPDVRSATTIREVLAAHQSDKNCAACHQSIDPFGYAFENFDPVGAWRDRYESESANGNRRNAKTNQGIAVDASASFRNGTQYKDITGFREMMRRPANQKRFVRCFIKKLLTYANGVEPHNYTAVDEILKVSAKHDYRIIETIAAVIDSPLFRETK